MLNISIANDINTARTMQDAAQQRAENLASLGCTKVLELCVGPSLKILEQSYNKLGIEVTGNDIENRWKKYYPAGKWIMGDALSISYAGFDGIVFAPPLSRGCTGKREDSLRVNQVFPRYTDFLLRADKSSASIYTMVLPARSIATSQDRAELFNLINRISIKNFKYEMIELRAKKRSVVKYVDLYFYR